MNRSPPPASCSQCQRDKMFAVVYSHLLCLSSSRYWTLCHSTVHLRLTLHGEASSLRLDPQPPEGPPGRLSEPLDTLVVKCRWWLTSDLSHSTLQQGRPLREQQEVAAAVIQRCYKKYKQVGTAGTFVYVPPERHAAIRNQHLTNNLSCIYQLNWV